MFFFFFRYPEKLIDAICKNFVKSMQQNLPNEEILTVPKKELCLTLPYLGNSSIRLNKSLRNLFKNAYPQVSLRVIFRTTHRIANLFSYKDTIPKRLKSFLVYRIHCTNCNSVYIGKTKRHLIKRFNEHLDVRKPTAVTEHLMRHNHDIDFNDVEVISTGKSDKELLIKESLCVKKQKPNLNNHVSSFPLELF